MFPAVTATSTSIDHGQSCNAALIGFELSATTFTENGTSYAKNRSYTGKISGMRSNRFDVLANSAYRPTCKAVNVKGFSYSVIAMPTDLKVEFIE